MFLSSREDMETWQPFGLDPFIVLGLSTMGFGVVGWLVGPIFGSTVFNVLYRRLREQFLLVSPCAESNLIERGEVCVVGAIRRSGSSKARGPGSN